MSKQRTHGRRLPFAETVGLALAGLIMVGVFAAGAASAPQGSAEMPTPRATPGIVGKPQEGQTLQATAGQWLYADGLDCSSRPLEPCLLTWQWQRCNPQATSCGDIPGQTSDKYLLAAADVGSRVRIVQILTKNDCGAHGGASCRDTASNQVSSPTDLVAPKPVAAPANTQLPEIKGNPMEEDTLTASTGLWSGAQPISMTWQWYRSDANGNGATPIAGATAQTYKLTSADVGSTIRVTGTATNAGGTSWATSQQTAVIAAFGPTAQRRSITADRVSSPHRLIIDRLSVSPSVLRSHRPFTARFHVSDTRGFLIEDALVQVASIPAGLIRTPAEIETNRAGWATFRLQPTDRLQLRKGGTLTLLLRAHKPGESLRAGASARRLVRVKLAAPVG